MKQEPGFTMHMLVERHMFFKAKPDVIKQLPFPNGQRKLLEIHRIHFDFSFFRWDIDIFYILMYGYQRTGFQEIISSVLHEILDSLTCFWELLNLVENHQRFSAKQFCVVF